MATVRNFRIVQISLNLTLEDDLTDSFVTQEEAARCLETINPQWEALTQDEKDAYVAMVTRITHQFLIREALFEIFQAVWNEERNDRTP